MLVPGAGTSHAYIHEDHAPERPFIFYARASMSKGMKAIHLRIVIGGVILLLAAAAWMYVSYFAVRA
jgi:hypothetical protein